MLNLFLEHVYCKIGIKKDKGNTDFRSIWCFFFNVIFDKFWVHRYYWKTVSNMFL